MTTQAVKFGKIKAIAITARDGEWLWYEVGREHNGRTVALIEDKGLEWENGVDFIYRVSDADGDVIAEIVNCAAIVEYDKREKDGEQ